MDPITLYVLAGVATVAVPALVWYARGVWDHRKATLLPRLVDAGLAITAEISRLEQSDPATEAARKASDAANAAKIQAFKDAAAGLK